MFRALRPLGSRWSSAIDIVQSIPLFNVGMVPVAGLLTLGKPAHPVQRHLPEHPLIVFDHLDVLRLAAVQHGDRPTGKLLAHAAVGLGRSDTRVITSQVFRRLLPLPGRARMLT